MAIFQGEIKLRVYGSFFDIRIPLTRLTNTECNFPHILYLFKMVENLANWSQYCENPIKGASFQFWKTFGLSRWIPQQTAIQWFYCLHSFYFLNSDYSVDLHPPTDTVANKCCKADFMYKLGESFKLLIAQTSH